MFLVYLWNTNFFWNFGIFDNFLVKMVILRLKLIKTTFFWKIHPFFGGLWGFGPPGTENQQDTANAGNLGVPDLFKRWCFLNVQRGTRWCRKMHKMTFFPEVSRQFWIKKYKKIRNFYKNCCFSGWHPGEGKLNTKNTKK